MDDSPMRRGSQPPGTVTTPSARMFAIFPNCSFTATSATKLLLPTRGCKIFQIPRPFKNGSLNIGSAQSITARALLGWELRDSKIIDRDGEPEALWSVCSHL